MARPMKVYHYFFERRGDDAMRGLAFFFGLMFIAEVALIMLFGVDFRYVHAPYITTTWNFGDIALPLRLAVPFAGSVLMLAALELFLRKTFIGRAIVAVAQDPLRFGWWRSLRSASSGSLSALPAPAPHWPAPSLLSSSRCSRPSAAIHRPRFRDLRFRRPRQPAGHPGRRGLAGPGRKPLHHFIGASWSPAVAFGLLLATLAWRPSGLFGRS